MVSFYGIPFQKELTALVFKLLQKEHDMMTEKQNCLL